jgi:flagellar hook-associated protein 1 FlgK
MSLNSVFLSGLSGLRAAQSGLNVVSQNIANANTPGYVRGEAHYSPSSVTATGGGVEVASIRRAADRFLATASYLAEAASGAASARANILDRAQSAFGDPAGGSTVFALLDDVWSAITEIGVDPSSALRRNDVVSALEATYAETQRLGAGLQELIAEADERIGQSVAEAQDLINRIAELNKQIQLTKRTGADVSGAENAQSALIDRLSSLIGVTVSPQAEGGVHVRTSGGALLVGVEAAQISYTPNSSPYASHGVISLNAHLGASTNLEPYLLSGEIAGLIQVRDEDLTGLIEALGGFSAALGDALNEVHNQNTSSPALGDLTGRQTGLIGSDAIGFSGVAVIGVVDASGVLSQRLTIDFDAFTISGEDPLDVYDFSGGALADFEAALNDALAAATPPGSATFEGGVLSLTVGNSGGLVIQQDTDDPALRAGRGFSHFFGLNDVVSRDTPLFFESGVDGGDAHGFAASGELVYQIRDGAGRQIANRTITLAGVGATWDELVDYLNTDGVGLGEFGTFTLDSATGRITLEPKANFSVALAYDSTQRGDTAISFSALNGLSASATAGRALDVSVNAQLSADPSRLAVGRPDLSGALGERVVEYGDGRGAAALVAIRDTQRDFPAAGVLGAQRTTFANYASRLGGEAGRLAEDALRSSTGAKAVATAAADRRAQIEGVTIDDELMKMTVYQNAYAAAARVIQTATEMLDILLSLGYR